MFESIGYGTYVFFVIWCALAAVWAWFLVPEVSSSEDDMIHHLTYRITDKGQNS